MRSTDYSEIAAKYDRHEARHDNPPDPHLAAELARRSGPFRVLDVACGTGNYLLAQQRAFPDARVRWHGIDASEAMLEQARAKLEGVDLASGRAESLPVPSAAYEYLSCNFAFHHFADKPRALDEMGRALVSDGALRIANVAPEHMRDWWVFQAFPAARHEDQKRFWPVDLLLHELERRAFSVRAEIHITTQRMSAAEAHRQAEGRDLSSIAILDEDDFRAGMTELAALAARGASLLTTTAIATLNARRLTSGS